MKSRFDIFSLPASPCDICFREPGYLVCCSPWAAYSLGHCISCYRAAVSPWFVFDVILEGLPAEPDGWAQFVDESLLDELARTLHYFDVDFDHWYEAFLDRCERRGQEMAEAGS